MSSLKKTSTRKVRFSEQINVMELQYQEADNYIEATINNAEEYTTNEGNIDPHFQHNQNHLYNERWKSEANCMPSNNVFPTVPIRYNASLIDVYDIIDAVIAIIEE
jgi:ribosome-associated translation inhibitor RaiA